MAKVLSEKQINAFVKGLITEASPLTFPENASMDEENFDLESDGSRARRLGVDYETGYTLTATGIATVVLQSTKQSSHSWYFPGGSSTVVLGVIRVYNKLYFIDLLKANPSANLKNSGNYITISGLENSEIQTTVINGYFIIVGKDLPYPIILSYDKNTDVVSQSQIQMFVRDTDGVFDSYASDFRPTTLTNEHKYNLINQGWTSKIVSTCFIPGSPWQMDIILADGTTRHFGIPANDIGAIECTRTTIGVYPSNADQWSLGKKGTAYDAATLAELEKYDPNLLKRNSLSNVQVPKGSIIIDPFTRGTSRNTYSGISGLPLDKENGRFSTVTSYAGRIFYSGVTSDVTSGDRFSPNYSGYVFFSQIATAKEKLGLCYQENDPTSPEISDLLDTDGGTIQIPEATKITKLVTTRSSLVIFAENGIWELYGDTKGFVATSYQVSKVSNIGVSNPNTIVDANGTILYWAKTGIHVLVQDPQTGRLITQNLSLSTIQSKYNVIPDIGKLNARGFFDESHNHVRWLYNDSDTYSETNYINHYTKELNLDLSLQAFYIYTISSLASNSPHISDYINIPGYSLTTIPSDVYVGNDPVIITSTDTVIINTTTSTTRSGTYNFLTFRGDSFTLSKYSNNTFYDWVTADGVGVNFSSYLITGYELAGDILRNKQVPYIFFYFDRTEDGFSLNGSDLILDHQSGCYVQAQWDWTNSANSGKWGPTFQAYRLLRPYVPTGAADTFDYGDRVIVTKNKLRGFGKSLSLKITSQEGKDMKLLGWAFPITGNSKE